MNKIIPTSLLALVAIGSTNNAIALPVKQCFAPDGKTPYTLRIVIKDRYMAASDQQVRKYLDLARKINPVAAACTAENDDDKVLVIHVKASTKYSELQAIKQKLIREGVYSRVLWIFSAKDGVG